LRIPELEKTLGIEVYASQSPGIGGRLRQLPEDFVVEEILIDGSKAEISPVKGPQPLGRGRYLVCAMVKRNWDTFHATKTVAKRLGVSPEQMSIAGIKDAKALTAQHISISRTLPEQVAGVDIKGIALRPLRFSNEKMYSELLLGNEFHILIRAISHKASVVEQRVKQVQAELSAVGGVPNFFGHQRFGTIRPITHIVGRFLTQDNWEKAALTYLAEPSQHEHPESREARRQLNDTQDFSSALHSFPKSLRYERLMLRHLAKSPNDFVGAFRRLPIKLRRLFVQAYQSYLFNKFLSERIRHLSLTEVYAGDYVVKLGKHGLATREVEQATAQSLQSFKKVLDENTMRVGIPLVGFRQGTSAGVQGEIEQKILRAEGIEPQSFYIPAMPEISAPGRLRPVLASIMNSSVDAVCKDSVNSSKREVGLSFRLHRGSYATVVLREFMKPQDLIKAGF